MDELGPPCSPYAIHRICCFHANRRRVVTADYRSLSSRTDDYSTTVAMNGGENCARRMRRLCSVWFPKVISPLSSHFPNFFTGGQLSLPSTLSSSSYLWPWRLHDWRYPIQQLSPGRYWSTTFRAAALGETGASWSWVVFGGFAMSIFNEM